jgi:hypothetical protein
MKVDAINANAIRLGIPVASVDIHACPNNEAGGVRRDDWLHHAKPAQAGWPVSGEVVLVPVVVIVLVDSALMMSGSAAPVAQQPQACLSGRIELLVGWLAGWSVGYYWSGWSFVGHWRRLVEWLPY